MPFFWIPLACWIPLMVPLCFEVDATASTSTSGRLVNLGVGVAQVSPEMVATEQQNVRPLVLQKLQALGLCMFSLIDVTSCMAKAVCMMLVGSVFGSQDLSKQTYSGRGPSISNFFHQPNPWAASFQGSNPWGQLHPVLLCWQWQREASWHGVAGGCQHINDCGLQCNMEIHHKHVT